jgi:release factor glutamine methyltransferase
METLSLKNLFAKYHGKIPASEIRILLCDVLQVSLEQLILNLNNTFLTKELLESFTSKIKRRINGEPIAYITGKQEFYGLEFNVNKDVLIPRPETEIMIEEAIKFFPADSKINILDLCTGSGAIAVTLSNIFKSAKIIASDISEEALKLSALNAEKHKAKNIKFIRSDYFKNISKLKFDVILSNPPYISEKQKNLMSLETLNFEPKIALFADKDGYAAYETIEKNAAKFLKPRGIIILEIGIGMEEKIEKIFLSQYIGVKHLYQLINITKDLSGINRTMIFQMT